MTAQEIENIIARAIQTALIDYPNVGDGTTWPAHTMDGVEAQHRAKAVMRALAAANLTVQKSN